MKVTVISVGSPKAPGVAAALNGAVVPKTEWNSAKLADGDTIDIIHAVQGG